MPAEQQFPDYPRLAADAATRQQGKRFLLLSPERGSWCVVDAAGYRLARQCDGNRHWRALAMDLASRYDTSLEQVLSDVQAYLRQLAGAGLLDQVATTHPDRVNISQAKSPMQVTLHLTSRCNLHCQHCHKPPAMASTPYPSLKTVCDWIDQCVDAGTTHLDLTGGEPLTHPQWGAIVRYAASRAAVTVLTNGVLIDEAAATILAETGVTVQISVDGPNAAVHEALRGLGTYAPMRAGISRLLTRGIGSRLVWSVCLNQHNLTSIEAILEQALALGVSQVYLIRVMRQGMAAAHWAELGVSAAEFTSLLHDLQPWMAAHPGLLRLAGCDGMQALAHRVPGETGCPLTAGKAALIDADGAVYPCIQLAAPSFCLGSMTAGGLSAALHSSRMRELRAQAAHRADQVDSCRQCMWRRFCGGACPGQAWQQTRDWQGTDDLCALRDSLFTQTIFQCVEWKEQCAHDACEGEFH